MRVDLIDSESTNRSSEYISDIDLEVIDRVLEYYWSIILLVIAHLSNIEYHILYGIVKIGINTYFKNNIFQKFYFIL